MMRNYEEDTSYSEAQAMVWLSWLAKGMKAHKQTIFLIEQLQPSWLDQHTQRRLYLLISRMIWGVASGLVYGLVYGLLFGFMGEQLIGIIERGKFNLSERLIYGEVFGLSVGLGIGLFIGPLVGLIDVVRLTHKPLSSETKVSPPRRQSSILIFGLLIGLLVGVVGALLGALASKLTGIADGPISGLIFGVIYGFVYGMIYGLFWELRSLERTFRNEIQTVETIMVRFSWPHFFRAGSSEASHTRASGTVRISGNAQNIPASGVLCACLRCATLYYRTYCQRCGPVCDQ